MQSTTDSGWEFVGQIAAAAQSRHDLFTFTDRFCRHVQTSSLDDEKIKNLYKIGANFIDPRELPDLTGLDWEEAIYQCLESFVPPSAFLPVQASLPKMAAASASRRKMAATPEPHRKMAANPESLFKTCTALETRSVGLHRPGDPVGRPAPPWRPGRSACTALETRSVGLHRPGSPVTSPGHPPSLPVIYQRREDTPTGRGEYSHRLYHLTRTPFPSIPLVPHLPSLNHLHLKAITLVGTLQHTT
ncbi:hypothetical protein DPX16_8617 [Anabarilius grahami]|uniref:Uncharacterized protein n=1 Tax=Anabarilius grahami TaxID=495550 RepID=A0A3N0Z1V0_ANAGA|nr:hypothetical protein DPX16_8617 [Anabarilius grahami]